MSSVKLWKCVPQDIWLSMQNRDQEIQNQQKTLENIADVLHPKYREKALKILNKVKDDDQFSWDEYGRIVVGGQVIQSSNLSDILSITIRPTPLKTFEIPGLSKFAECIIRNNVPRTLFNPSFRKHLESGTAQKSDRQGDDQVVDQTGGGNFEWITFDERYKKQ